VTTAYSPGYQLGGGGGRWPAEAYRTKRSLARERAGVSGMHSYIRPSAKPHAPLRASKRQLRRWVPSGHRLGVCPAWNSGRSYFGLEQSSGVLQCRGGDRYSRRGQLEGLQSQNAAIGSVFRLGMISRPGTERAWNCHVRFRARNLLCPGRNSPKSWVCESSDAGRACRRR
jgi:hypothetical protein